MKTSLVTGGASGIGEATARRLARTMRVIIADIDGDKAEQTAADIRKDGFEAHGMEVDVSQAAAVRRMTDTVISEYGSVDKLFNNAGRFSPEDTMDIARAEWDGLMAVHVKSVFLCCKAILPGMIERGAGTIVNMSSDYAVRGMFQGALYATAKSSIFSLTKSLALEFASYGIRVNAVGPGPIETPLLKGTMSEAEWQRFRAERARLVPMGRLGRPEEVAAVVDFLLSDESSYITGQIIHPNGGQLSW